MFSGEKIWCLPLQMYFSQCKGLWKAVAMYLLRHSQRFVNFLNLIYFYFCIYFARWMLEY